MIYSMTGYAVAARELESAVLNLELPKSAEGDND